jgi:hypothetical protein
MTPDDVEYPTYYRQQQKIERKALAAQQREREVVALEKIAFILEEWYQMDQHRT